MIFALSLSVACSSSEGINNPQTGGSGGGGSGGGSGSGGSTGGSGGSTGGSGGTTGGSGGTTGGSGGTTGGTAGSGGSAGKAGSGGSGGTAGSGGSTGGSAGSGGTTGGTAGSGGSTGGSAGSGGSTGGTAGSGGTGGGTDGGCPKMTTKPTQVVWIGDSYPASGTPPGGIQRYTEASAVANGSLASGSTYRSYWVSGTQMANGEIPGQYTKAHTENPDITTVIMTGGGNDILIGNASCLSSPPPTNTSCIDTINKATDAAVAMMTQMQTDGVKNVIYYFYPRTTLLQSGANVDYAFPIVKAGCDKFKGPLTCTFVDTRPPFVGQNWFSDGIHPTDPGQKAIADLIWGVMSSQCIAQ
jgi:lysophospholipase L1-like esterase